MRKQILGAILVLLLSASSALAMDVTLAWDANTEPDLAGYNLYWSEVQGVPSTSRTKVTFLLSSPGFNPASPLVTITGLPNDKRIYFVVTAFDNEVPSLESGYSNEVYADTYTGKPPKNPILRLIQWIISMLFGEHGLRIVG